MCDIMYLTQIELLILFVITYTTMLILNLQRTEDTSFFYIIDNRYHSSIKYYVVKQFITGRSYKIRETIIKRCTQLGIIVDFPVYR